LDVFRHDGADRFLDQFLGAQEFEISEDVSFCEDPLKEPPFFRSVSDD
jgi:hypothetical protein